MSLGAIPLADRDPVGRPCPCSSCGGPGSSWRYFAQAAATARPPSLRRQRRTAAASPCRAVPDGKKQAPASNEQSCRSYLRIRGAGQRRQSERALMYFGAPYCLLGRRALGT
eukprot:jgi/Tetstr1/434712/TSEL_023766.t1